MTTSSGEPLRRILETLTVVRAANEYLYAGDGTAYLDLFTGAGTVLLGHARPAIAEAIREQLGEVWITGLLRTPVVERARAAIEAWFPPTHRAAALYSTGMEAAEFALRVARGVTGRADVAGFAGSMHGKSLGTALLGWTDPLVTLPHVHRLPYVPELQEAEVLSLVEGRLANRTVGALFVEPLQGSSGGHMPSRAFFQDVQRLCRETGTLLVVDEIFTGFHRAGPAFLHQALDLSPDLVLVGKAMSNGFPASAVIVDRRHAIEPSMLPGSTYAGNSLAAAAIVATLDQMRALDVASRVSRLEAIAIEELGPLRDAGLALRGSGALWILELPRDSIDRVVAGVFERRVLTSVAGRYLRVLPAATMAPALFADGCRAIRETIERVMAR